MIEHVFFLLVLNPRYRQTLPAAGLRRKGQARSVVVTCTTDVGMGDRRGVRGRLGGGLTVEIIGEDRFDRAIGPRTDLILGWARFRTANRCPLRLETLRARRQAAST
jgi:hypothetical protein